MKTKIYKNRFCDLNTRPNPELLKDCFFPDEIKGYLSVYRMSYLELVKETELLKNLQSEEDFINLINAKIYVIPRNTPPSTKFERPYTGGILMNEYLKIHYKDLSIKYRLLFE